ncbi:MAG: DUF4299 domain-containing protein [Oscillospiraceae bacterium]|nr:DUF4299 domain-containing protein [Oscillospiraceae bacterium]
MSIDIEITQKGLFKKKLGYKTIIGDLGYGVYENNTITEGKLGRDFIVYDKKRIGRGISIICGRDEKEKVIMRMLSPTCEEEIDTFYGIIGRIAKAWKCDILQDGEAVDPNDFGAICEDMKKANKSYLKTMLEKNGDFRDGNVTLFSAMWQLDLGDEDKAEILASDDIVKAYGDWLHRLQEMDVYYAMPRFYGTNDGILGMYFITEDTESAIPLVPSVPFGVADGEGKPLKADNWEVCFYSITRDENLGKMSYEKFVEKVRGMGRRYDASRIIIGGMSSGVLEDLLAEN